MKVVLRSDVEGVGRRGDIIEVAGGFARNFLLPQGRALMATDGVTAQATSMRRSRDLREAHDREAAVAQAQILSGATVMVPEHAGPGGRLFGSVAALDVVNAIRDQKGVEIDRQHIVFGEPIKTIGTHEISITLFEDVTALVTLDVVAGD